MSPPRSWYRNLQPLKLQLNLTEAAQNTFLPTQLHLATEGEPFELRASLDSLAFSGLVPGFGGFVAPASTKI